MEDHISRFIRRINRRAQNLERSVERLRLETTAEMLREVVRGTPVDKGVARSNWQVGVNSPATSLLPAYSPGYDLGIGETANASAAISTGLATIFSSRPEDILYISNNTPYILRLNNGYSKQAPAGFVELAFQRAAQRVRRAGRLLE